MNWTPLSPITIINCSIVKRVATLKIKGPHSYQGCALAAPSYIENDLKGNKEIALG